MAKRRKTPQRWQLVRQRLSGLLTQPVKLTYPFATATAQQVAALLLGAYGRAVQMPKALYFDLKSVRRPWSRSLAIRVRLKW